MERLTMRTPKGAAVKMDEPANEAEARKMLMEKFHKVCEKLAHYEDLAEAGRLVELPCKVGDIVWFIGKDHGSKENSVFLTAVKGIETREGKWKIRLMDFISLMSFDDIGKVIFLTREEAEAALKGR